MAYNLIMMIFIVLITDYMFSSIVYMITWVVLSLQNYSIHDDIGFGN